MLFRGQSYCRSASVKGCILEVFGMEDRLTLTFSSYFGVPHDLIEEYGALDISLVNDLPLFIDPFLLFCSEKAEYRKIHDHIVKYILFLKSQAEAKSGLSKAMYRAWFAFPEVKQNWLGFSENGNSGRGMGFDFAEGLFEGLCTVFSDFGTEEMLESPHMEKFSLIRPKIGKDKISDFTANFAKAYLLQYTQAFAKKHIDKSQLALVNVDKVYFDYRAKRWMPRKYFLPIFQGDYVLLTPKDILTRDDTFINRSDMIRSALEFAPSIGDEALRFSFSEFLYDVLRDDKKSKKEKDAAITEFISKHPEIVNYYIRFKESVKERASIFSEKQVELVDEFFIDAAASLSAVVNETTRFYDIRPSSFEEAKERVLYLKHVIEDQDGYRLLWRDGRAPAHESELQLLFKFVWCGTDFDVNREANNGRGPADYVVSKGAADKTIVEFKLAKNSKLRQNLENQVEIYKRANKTDAAIEVIVFFSEREQKKVERVLNELGLAGNEQIVLIDARCDNKISASNVKTERPSSSDLEQ